MVSRGGRSKGCTNCRRRKVKCDEARPSCHRCKKLGISCDGPKDHTWIHQNEPRQSQSPPKDLIVTTSPQVELSLAAFEEDICLAYTRKNLLRGGPVELACNMISLPENVSILDTNPALDLLRNAILSLSVTFFGKQHCQDRITAKGYCQYGEVLRHLNTALGDPTRQVSNETILTALTCMLLEIFLPTGPTNFLKHQRGIEALMALRGPPTESVGDTAIIFRGLRIVSIIGALADGRASIYSKEEWKNAPVVSTGELGELHNKMFAILAECTLLISDSDAVLKSHMGKECYQPLLNRVDRTFADLNALYHEWKLINDAQLQIIDQLSPLAKELGIANHLSATAYMLYHTVHLCILRIKDSLVPSPSNMQLRNAAATNIAVCLELKEYEKRQGVAESNTIGFVATKVAWQALGGFRSPEGRRLAHVVRSAVNGVYRSTWGQLGSGDISFFLSPNPFAQFGSAAPATLVTRLEADRANHMHLIPPEPEVINIGFKDASPTA
ncbi:hypothetical protein EK21DRAFT_87288 [Setomelanomma holmii]|uniref:Zn(2)-C6 fungal-type domain-containing protein n=1 Tax=Setomelanomma holmii TaxID=210430 RepID=A0A9P4LNW3_9PLEO|nr:hypothetical protein EK21DRAFT_87288 [Setomelanomma holmii]